MLTCLHLTGCSWIVPFYILNDTAQPHTVEISISRPKSGFAIFEPRQFRILAWKGDEPDYENVKPIAPQQGEKMRIEIPPYSALEIGRLSNQNYEGSEQSFINGRVFNLISVKAGKSVVTRATFNAHFKKTSAGYVWKLPGE